MDGAHIDIPKMMAQKDKAVTGLTKGVEGLFKKNKVRILSKPGRSPCIILNLPLDLSRALQAVFLWTAK